MTRPEDMGMVTALRRTGYDRGWAVERNNGAVFLTLVADGDPY